VEVIPAIRLGQDRPGHKPQAEARNEPLLAIPARIPEGLAAGAAAVVPTDFAIYPLLGKE
jgi:hypothetical protein